MTNKVCECCVERYAQAVFTVYCSHMTVAGAVMITPYTSELVDMVAASLIGDTSINADDFERITAGALDKINNTRKELN